MPFVAAFCFALATSFVQAERFETVECASADGRFVARVRKAEGQEHVDDVLARWKLTVEARDREGRTTPYWSALIQHRAGARVHVVADDGLGFVEVDVRASGVHASGARELVRVWHAAREPYTLDADELALEANELAPEGSEPALDGSEPGVERESGPWLDTSRAVTTAWFESPLGPVQQLELVLASGAVRRVDLASGAVYTSREWQSQLVCGPQIADELRKHADVGYVLSAAAPRRAYFGEELEVEIRGSHPTPGWHFAGFDVRAEPVEGETLIVLTPLSLAPPNDRAQAQVLRDFECAAMLAGLAPGRYAIRVVGRDVEGREPLPALELEVQPARPWVELELVGGRTVRVYPSGTIVFARANGERNVRVLDQAERERFEAAYRALPERAEPESWAPVKTYALRWSRAEKHLELRGDAQTLEPRVLGLVELLAAEAAR
ncbi:MAG: hypothetical protein L6Q99_20015 [Planctomycetes bacterium]|nr:hypothetical protein [Planctomycetota bacterium]